MATYTEKFKSLAAAYRGASIEFPKLKPVTIAQWMYESGRGSSKLATDHNSFAGLEMAGRDGRFCHAGNLPSPRRH